MSRPCALVLTSSREPGVRAARAAGLEPLILITKEDCAGRLGEPRARARREGIRMAVIHSPDWSRQPMQQLFEMAAMRLGMADVRVIDDEGHEQARLTHSRLAGRLAALPLEAAAAGALTCAEGTRLALHRIRRRRPAPAGPGVGGGPVLAVWNGSPETRVGGSVTHIAGVLGAFRRAGLRVGLLTSCAPPDQLAAVVDDLEVVPAVPPAARLTSEVAAVAINRFARPAGRRLADRLQPAFVYMRYDAYVGYGVRVAEDPGVPLVLEWNNSEVWTRARWQVQRLSKRAFRPWLVAAEREALARATLVVAISGQAAEMARRAGGDPGRIIVVPNGVDIQAIDDAGIAETERAEAGARVGWVGSFGPWHGAEMLVRALPDLPGNVTAVMVGDGPALSQCQGLAKEIGVDGRVEFTGPLPHPDAVRVLAGCDVLASPHVPMDGQDFFGSPTKLFEYMALGRPIVASALEQIGEVLENGRTGVLVAPGDPVDLARGIRDVLDSDDGGRDLGEAARSEAERAHTWDARARAILDGLAESSSSSPTGRPIKD